VTGHAGATRCTICANPQVSEVDALLGTGTSIRGVARMYGLARSTVARHRDHVAPGQHRFALIRAQGAPDGPPDPLAEAFALAERSRTPRERLRALEQVRAATKMQLRGAGKADPDAIALLDANIAQAEAAFRNAGDFETAARGLSGWREAITQRVDAIRHPDAIEVPVVITHADGSPLGEPMTVPQAAELYWAGVPKRYRDADRFVVHRELALTFVSTRPSETIKVREVASGAMVWAK
jgi:hypothetical protein